MVVLYSIKQYFFQKVARKYHNMGESPTNLFYRSNFGLIYTLFIDTCSVEGTDSKIKENDFKYG